MGLLLSARDASFFEGKSIQKHVTLVENIGWRISSCFAGEPPL